MAFSHTWQALQQELTKQNLPINISNQTVQGPLFNFFSIKYFDSSHVTVETIDTNKSLQIYKSDFEKIYDLWPKYIAKLEKREDLRNESFHTTYIISIFYWLQNKLGNLP